MPLPHLSSVIGSRESLAENVSQMDRCTCILSLDTPPKRILGGGTEVQRGGWVRIEFDGERFRKKKEDEMGAG